MLLSDYFWMMVLFASALSVVLFIISQFVVSTIVRTLYLRVTQKMNWSYQFVGEYFGGGVACYFGIKVFGWFDSIDAPVIVLTALYVVSWFILNNPIDKQFHPTAQRVGAVLGILSGLAQAI